MAAPVPSAIRRSHPDSFIAWAVESRCAPVVDNERLVDVRFEVPRDKWKQGGAGSSWFAQLRYFAKLREYNFDIGMDLQGHAKTALCLRLSGAKKRLAVRSKDPLANSLNPNPAPFRLEHTVEHNLEVLSAFGLFDSDATPIMPSLEDSRARIALLISSKPLATITVSTGNQLKNYPTENWLAVGRGLQRQGYQVAYLGGPGDPSVALPDSIDWVGKLPLEQTMAAVSLSDIHFAGDTGSGHMAAAYGVPVVSVFVGTSPARYRPYTERGVVVDGTSGVAPEQVLDAGLGLLERHGKALSH